MDGRKARGKRYDVAGLLVVLVLAKLAGMTSVLGASEWITDQEELLREGLGLTWNRMPCANTYSYVLARLDSQAVNAHLAAWLVRKEAESRCGEEPSRLAAHPSDRHVHLAIDGKALKGTGTQAYGGEKPQKHVLHVYEVQTGIVLHQCPIAVEHNEVSTLKPVLTEVLCKGRILTTDAAQSYHEFGRLVQRAGGDVILIVKDNTPATRADLELFFEDPEADRRTWQAFEQVEKGHGRLERRSILTSPDRGALSAPGLGRGGAGVSRATRTHQPRPDECGGHLRLDKPFSWAVFAKASLAPQSWALGRGKLSALETRCPLGRGSLPRSLSACSPHARRAQLCGPLLDGSTSGFSRRSPNSPLFLSSRGGPCLAHRLLRNPGYLGSPSIMFLRNRVRHLLRPRCPLIRSFAPLLPQQLSNVNIQIAHFSFERSVQLCLIYHE